MILDEAELQRHHQLERLYISTKAAKVRLVILLDCEKDIASDSGTERLDETANTHAIFFL